jgi:hypothetical protein
MQTLANSLLVLVALLDPVLTLLEQSGLLGGFHCYWRLNTGMVITNNPTMVVFFAY